MTRAAQTVMAVIVFLLSSCLYCPPAQATPSKTVLSVKSSPDSEMETMLVIQNNRDLERSIGKGARKPAIQVPISDTRLTIIADDRHTTYLIDANGNVFHEQHREMVDLAESVKRELKTYRDLLRSLHYGSMVHWDSAKKMLPKKRKFKVMDIETGLSFRVQRRAGKNHADVQPLTKEDTAIMKQIYNGAWSWQRKAILVESEGRLLAASMHGMPHGGDGIPDNDFSGHFCIHFAGSSTHGSGSIDPDHQLMIRKAAGKLQEYVENASPYELIDTFLMSFHLEEPQIASMSFAEANHALLEYFFKAEDRITAIRKRSAYIVQDTSDALTMDIPVPVAVYRKGKLAEKTTFTFQLRRASLYAPWKIDSIILSASPAEPQ